MQVWISSAKKVNQFVWSSRSTDRLRISAQAEKHQAKLRFIFVELKITQELRSLNSEVFTRGMKDFSNPTWLVQQTE